MIQLKLFVLLQDVLSPQYQNVGATATAASVATILTRLEELSRRVAVLETGLTSDVRRILQLLQAREAAHHNAQPAHTPSQPLPKASLSVPQSNEVNTTFFFKFIYGLDTKDDLLTYSVTYF